MRRGHLVELSALVLGVGISRFLCRSHRLYDIDSVNFALGIDHFNPRGHQPHPPGYFLYICLGRLLNLMFHDANLALVMLSILASCGAVAIIYLLAHEWFSVQAARWAGCIFLLSPLAWFHGIVSLTYSLESFFSALLGYLCWRLQTSQSTSHLLAAAAVLGTAAGVRPSSLLFLGPLFLFSLRKLSLQQKFLSLALLAATLSAWFFPMLYFSGGWTAYFGALASLWIAVPGHDTVFNSSPATSIARFCTVVFIAFLFCGAAILTPLAARLGSRPGNAVQRVFTLVWMTPALLFFTFVFLKFVNSGYLLIVAAPASMWMGHWLSEWHRASRWPQAARWALVGFGAALNIGIFLWFPAYCSLRSVRHFEAELQSITEALPRTGAPSDTLIVGFDSHFLGYRHAGYYLPAYETVEYPGVKLTEGVRIFSMQNRDTHLLANLDLHPFTRYVLFPLPHGDAANDAYLNTVRRKIPSGQTHSVWLNGHEFVTGPVSDLRFLFPDAILDKP